MKKFLSRILTLLLVLSLTACGGNGDQPDQTPDDAAPQQSDAAPSDAAGDEPVMPNPAANSKLVFSFNGCPLPMNAEFGPLLDAIGEPDSYFEAASCAFEGLDKTYTYSGVEIITYPYNDVDYISSIRLLDDTVSTPEGISIGSSQEDVTTAYGSDFEDLGTGYSYEDGDTILEILFQDGAVVSVEYIAVNDLLG